MKVINRIGIRCWIILTLLLPSACIPAYYTETPETVTVTFYHTSDIHENSANLPQIARFISDQKKKKSNVLFLDSGDRFNKGDLTPLNTRGEAISAMMEGMLYDAMICGNHDLTFGSERLLELVDKYSLPLLCANCVWGENNNSTYVPPYNIYALDGVTVAIIGTAAKILEDPDGLLEVHWETSDMIESLKSVVSDLQSKADVIVLMTHRGHMIDRELAKALPNIDLIAGGHWHETLETPIIDEKNQTVIQHSGCCGMVIGEIVFKWDGKEIVDRKVQVIKITSDMSKSTELEAMRKSYLTGQ